MKNTETHTRLTFDKAVRLYELLFQELSEQQGQQSQSRELISNIRITPSDSTPNATYTITVERIRNTSRCQQPNY